MTTIAGMRSELARLEAQAKQIRDQGDAIAHPDFFLDTTGNGKTSKRYYRRRWFDSDGRKHSESLSREAYNELKVAIARGKQLAELEREIAQVQQQLEKVLAIAVELGLGNLC